MSFAWAGCSSVVRYLVIRRHWQYTGALNQVCLLPFGRSIGARSLFVLWETDLSSGFIHDTEVPVCPSHGRPLILPG
ncbi:hypothetical protein AB7M23_002456 [Pseudomonas sp. HLS-6 TE3448]